MGKARSRRPLPRARQEPHVSKRVEPHVLAWVTASPALFLPRPVQAFPDSLQVLEAPYSFSLLPSRPCLLARLPLSF